MQTDSHKVMRLLSGLLMGALSMISCNDSKFRATHNEPAPTTHIVNINGIDDYDAGERSIRRIDTLDFTVQAAAEKVLQSINSETFPVDMYFVVDTTNSMGSSLQAVRDSIIELSQQLRNSGMDLQAGFIGFVDTQADSQTQTMPLTNDLAALSQFIRTVPQHRGNDDFPEGSLWASQEAIRRFQMGEGRANAAKIILLVTDDVGHNGTSGGQGHNPWQMLRDCSVAPLQNAINSYAATLARPDLFRFYYAIPDSHHQPLQNATERYPCQIAGLGYANAKAQFNQLMQGVLPDLAAEQRGGPLLNSQGQYAWPLKDHRLADLLTSAIQTTRSSQDRVLCEARNIEAKANGVDIYRWSANDNVNSSASNSIYLGKVIADIRDPGQQNVEFKIDRCCVAIDDVSGRPINRDTCVQRFTQTVRYRVTNY